MSSEPLHEAIVRIAAMELASQREAACDDEARGRTGVTKTGLLTDVRNKRKQTAEDRKRACMPPSDSLAGSLVADEDGLPILCLNNLILILENHREWKSVFWLNEFTGDVEVFGGIPGDNSMSFDAQPYQLISDAAISRTTAWFNRNFFPFANSGIVWEAIKTVAMSQTHDPVKTYLMGLEWDGVGRIDKLWLDYFGAAASPYAKATGAKFLISAVARVFRPGCKVDTMPVLEGKQGSFKSSAIAALFGREYFGDALPDIKGKDASQYLKGKWVVEKAELEQFRRNEWDTIKAFISRQTEDYRKPYAKTYEREPRRTVFIGSTNGDTYLSDPTGARRIWPVAVGYVDLKAIEKDRDQLLAEAVHRFKAGENWWLDSALEAEADAVRNERKPVEPWTDAVDTFVRAQSEIFITDLMDNEDCLGLDKSQQHTGNAARVATILKDLGWTRGKKLKSGKNMNRMPWYPPEENPDQAELDMGPG